MTTLADAPSYHEVRRVVALWGDYYEIRVVACPEPEVGPDVFVTAGRVGGPLGKLSMPYGGLWELIDVLVDVAEQTETVP